MAVSIDVAQLKSHIKADAHDVTIRTGVKSQVILLAYQKTGYGQRLYQSEGSDWKCRKCSGVNPYYGIQNNTKGGYNEIAYRMRKYADKVGIQFSFPFNYLDFALDARIHKKKFRDSVKVLQALENMRFHSLFFKSQYKPKVIKSVMNGKHPIIQNVTLEELKNNIYDWNTGKQVIIPEQVANGLVKSL